MIHVRRGTVILFLAALSAPLLAAPEALKVSFEKYRLANGLTVILHEDHRLPTVVVDLWFKVGSKDEKTGRTGFAHLFEHLMFMGTKNVPNGQFDAIMEAYGGTNNASTSQDRTNYFESGPANLLSTFLFLEADRLATLPEDMTKEKVDLQRDVVKNERRQSYENRPYGKVFLAVPEHMYPEGHPYHHPVIGSHADLTAASVDDVKSFFRTFYVPSNASLVVAGDFKSAEAKELVETYFGWMPKKPEPPHASPAPAALAKPDRVVLKDTVPLPRVTLVWHSPEAFGPGDAECDLLASLLGDGKSSRLYRALVYEKKLAQSVDAMQDSNRYGSLFMVTATAQPGHTAEELEKALDAELKRLSDSLPTAPEVERARATVETRLLREIESLFGAADALNAFEFRFGDPGELARRFLSRYALKPADVARQAAAVLGKPRLTVHVVPEAAPAPKVEGEGR